MTISSWKKYKLDILKKPMPLGFDSASGASSPNAIVNILLFLIGGLAVLTWLPGIIVGIILLATRKSV